MPPEPVGGGGSVGGPLVEPVVAPGPVVVVEPLVLAPGPVVVVEEPIGVVRLVVVAVPGERCVCR